MSVVAWIILGLVSGFIASSIVSRRGAGTLRDVALGVVGALVGGALFNLSGASGVTGLNVRSMCVAVMGAVVVLVTYHAISRAPGFMRAAGHLRLGGSKTSAGTPGSAAGQTWDHFRRRPTA
jgi:uncharacterized membrane protein YeaQ/YmgE (transglycosylase-associated protein family)